VLARAVVGNLLVPGIGGIIGGISGIGDKKKSYALSNYLFVINFKNNDGNNSEIVFSCKAENTKESSIIDKFASYFSKITGFNHFDNILPDYIIKGFRITQGLSSDEKALLSNTSVDNGKTEPSVVKRRNYKIIILMIVIALMLLYMFSNGTFANG
jgi:hypothetical protein